MPMPPLAAPSSTNPGEPAGFGAAVSAAMFGGPALAAPDVYALLGDDKAAIQLLTDTRKFCDPGREAFEQGWHRILQYFLGRQWIYWDPGTRTYNDKRLAKWVPKPVTNKIRETYDSIYALMQDITPSVKPSPVGRAPKNVIAAETADEMAPLIHDEHDMDAVLSTADFWSILLGNSYLHPHWDKDDPSQRAQIALWRCNLCQAVVPPDAIVAAGQRCPNCQSQALVQAIDPTGKPMMQTVPIGKGRTIAISPLELLMPLYAQSFASVDRLIFCTWLPKHQVEEMAPEASKKIQWTMTPQQRGLQLYKSLSMQSDVPLSPNQWNTASGANEVEGCTVQYLWVKACKKYDQGIFLPFFGEGDSAIPGRELIEAANAENGEGSKPMIPYTDADGAALWPWVHYPYKRVAGRLYAQGAMDPILQKQDQINQIDSMTQLTATRMGNPIWMEPKGAEVERFTGEPGLIVRWQPIGANGAKPERIAGENPPASFFQLRQQYLADIEDGAGTYDVVKGSKPSGVEAFSALNLLVERSQSRFTPTFKARGAAYRDWFKVAIELERGFGPSERVHNIQGPNQTWTQKIFQSSKLQGSIEIKVEDGSNTPKTALGRRAAIEHASQLMLLNPGQYPDQAYALMQELGVANLSPTLDADVKACLQEQQAFEDWAAGGFQGIPPLMVMPWHNPQVHLTENRKWMNSDRVRDILAGAGPNAPAIIQVLGQHLQEHQMAMNASLMLQAQTQAPIAPGDNGGTSMPPPAGPGNGGTGAGRAMGDSNRQSGAAQPAPQQARSAA
jgi:hypothetical protein